MKLLRKIKTRRFKKLYFNISKCNETLFLNYKTPGENTKKTRIISSSYLNIYNKFDFTLLNMKRKNPSSTPVVF